jgi:CRP/FNR family transcriptional regulator, cyclic AMP receptor protein
MPIAFQKLAQVKLLDSLPEETVFRLSAQLSERRFARREVVIAKDHARPELGFLIEGRLQGVDFTVDGRSAGLYFVEPGDFFGELSVIDGLPPAEHVIAAAKSVAVFLEVEAARRLILDTPVLAQRVMLRLSSRVREVTAQRTLLSLPNPVQRLCVQLMQLAQPLAGSADIMSIDPAPTHQELAIMINASRETVTRAFQALTLKEAIQRNGTALLIVRQALLRDIALGVADLPRS